MTTKAAKRRARSRDPLATRAAVTSVLEQLRRAVGELMPANATQLRRMLWAVGQIERGKRAVQSQRQTQWRGEDLAAVATHLRRILARETEDRVSVRSFIEHYLNIPDLPAEVAAALECGEINLFEAEQLARVSVGRWGLTEREAGERRATLLKAHLLAQESGEQLRRRVNSLFDDATTSARGAAGEAANGMAEIETMFAGMDTTHLFYDHLMQIVIALRETAPDDLTAAEWERVFAGGDQMINVLHQAKRRRQTQRLRA